MWEKNNKIRAYKRRRKKKVCFRVSLFCAFESAIKKVKKKRTGDERLLLVNVMTHRFTTTILRCGESVVTKAVDFAEQTGVREELLFDLFRDWGGGREGSFFGGRRRDVALVHSRRRRCRCRRRYRCRRRSASSRRGGRRRREVPCFSKQVSSPSSRRSCSGEGRERR
jgi:hypothetical protein